MYYLLIRNCKYPIHYLYMAVPKEKAHYMFQMGNLDGTGYVNL
jgi:hypothetical protein